MICAGLPDGGNSIYIHLSSNDCWRLAKFFFKNTFKKFHFLLNRQLYWKNNSTVLTILLNKRFYYTIIHWENNRNSWKYNYIFENKENNIFSNNWKKNSQNEKSLTSPFLTVPCWTVTKKIYKLSATKNHTWSWSY